MHWLDPHHLAHDVEKNIVFFWLPRLAIVFFQNAHHLLHHLNVTPLQLGQRAWSSAVRLARSTSNLDAVGCMLGNCANPVRTRMKANRAALSSLFSSLRSSQPPLSPERKKYRYGNIAELGHVCSP